MSLLIDDLPYPYDALEPYMSRETLELHHDKHHLAYVNNGNTLLKGTGLQGDSVEEIIRATYSSRPDIFNNVGQHYNHAHFWRWMRPGGSSGALPAVVERAAVESFDSVERMKQHFQEAGIAQFGSGWCWLALRDGKLSIERTTGAESPLLTGGKPILGCDVWEHAYYVDYRARRADYLRAFVEHLVNWDYVAELLEAHRA